MTNYRRILRSADRNDPKAWAQTQVELQHELEREARECLRVSEGVRWESER